MPLRSSDNAVRIGPGSGNASELPWEAMGGSGTTSKAAPPPTRPPAPRATRSEPQAPPTPLPSCLEPLPPCTPSSGSTTQGSSTAGGTMEATSPPESHSGNRYRLRALPTGRLRALPRSAETRRTAAPETSGAAGAFATHQTRPAGTGGGGGSGSSSLLRPPQEARRQLGRSRERQQEALGPRAVRGESGACLCRQRCGSGRAAALTSRGVRSRAGVRGALLSRAATKCRSVN